MKKKLAQELVEFLLVAPFLIIIFGILTEYAYALNVNMTLANGLKAVSATAYANIKPNQKKEDIQKTLKDKLAKYMSENNVPMNAENNLGLEYMLAGDVAVVTASYTYHSAFTLPMIYINFLPPKFEFTTMQIVPSAFLKENDYGSSNTDGVWGFSQKEYTTLQEFEESKKGVAKSTISGNADTGKVWFLVPAEVDSSEYYQIVNWSGSSTNLYVKYSADPNEQYYLYQKTANGYVRLSQFFVSNLKAIYVADGDNYFADLSLDKQWLNIPSAPVADFKNDGALKLILGLVASKNSLTRGNYDNLMVQIYNPTVVSDDTSYKVSAFGETILVYPSSINISNLINTRKN